MPIHELWSWIITYKKKKLCLKFKNSSSGFDVVKPLPWQPGLSQKAQEKTSAPYVNDEMNPQNLLVGVNNRTWINRHH